MKRVLILMVLLLVAGMASADDAEVPYETPPKEFIKMSRDERLAWIQGYLSGLNMMVDEINRQQAKKPNEITGRYKSISNIFRRGLYTHIRKSCFRLGYLSYISTAFSRKSLGKG